jgi:hypothetical protein
LVVPSPIGAENGLAAGDDSCANPPSAGDGSACAWLNGLALVALLGCEKENPALCPNPDEGCPNGALAGACPNPLLLLVAAFPPKEKVDGDGDGEASFPKPEPNKLPLCVPNPEAPGAMDGAAVFTAPNPPPLEPLAPKENPEPLLAALKEEPLVAASPPRIGLASMLSSSRTFANGVVGPLGKTSAGTPAVALPLAGAPKENPLLAGAG